MHWEQTPTGHRCTRPGHLDEHGKPLEFPTGEVCPFCTADPGAPLEALESRPAGENQILANAATLRGWARRLAARGLELLDPTKATAREAETGSKLIAEARKCLVEAAGLEEPILRRDHTRFLAAERRRMHGGPAN